MHPVLHHLFVRIPWIGILLGGLFPGAGLQAQTLGVQLEGCAYPPYTEQVEAGAHGGLFYSFRLHQHLAIRTGIFAGFRSTDPDSSLAKATWDWGGYVMPTHVMGNGMSFKAGLTVRTPLETQDANLEQPTTENGPGIRLSGRAEAGYQGRVAEIALFGEVPLMNGSGPSSGWHLGISAALPLVHGSLKPKTRRRHWRRTLQPWADPKARSGRTRWVY